MEAFCLYGEHYKFSATRSLINNYMSGNLGHVGYKSALILRVLKEQRGSCQNDVIGSSAWGVYNNNPSKEALNETIYVCVDEVLLQVQRKERPK